MTAAGLSVAPKWVSALPEQQAPPITPVKDFLGTADHAKMNAFIGKKMDLSYENRILAQNVNELVEPFRSRNETHQWQTEFWGKWFTSAVLAYRYRPEPA